EGLFDRVPFAHELGEDGAGHREAALGLGVGTSGILYNWAMGLSCVRAGGGEGAVARQRIRLRPGAWARADEAVGYGFAFSGAFFFSSFLASPFLGSAAPASAAAG